jgi:hypothetical protein
MFFNKYNIFPQLRAIFSRLSNLEKNLERTNDKLDESLSSMKSNILRINNGERLNSDFIVHNYRYKDLSPVNAINELKRADINYYLLDVSNENFSQQFKSAVKVPLDDLIKSRKKLPSLATPIMVISEDGTSSILACRILISLNYLYVNNISGGYKFLKN